MATEIALGSIGGGVGLTLLFFVTVGVWHAFKALINAAQQ